MQCDIKISPYFRGIDIFILRCNIRALCPQPSGDRAMRDKGKQRNSTEPKGELASRTLAMPADSNPKGDIFGGWIMCLMDSAGTMSATPHAGGRVVTVAVQNITFLQPGLVGDTVSCSTDAQPLGRTCVRVDV